MVDWNRWAARANKLRKHPRRGRFLASRVLWHARLSKFFTAHLADGLRVRFYPSSISAALWVSPDARNDDTEVLATILRAGDHYLDCGANIGHLAIVARHLVGASGSVIAIEANPRIFGYCVGNLELNGFSDVKALNVALGAETGTVEISDRRDDDQNRVGEPGMQVAMRKLDDVIADEPVTFLKLDVEGFELNVLRGGAATLARASFVYTELSLSNSARFGVTPTDVEDVLLAAGFQLVRRDGAQWTLSRGHVFDPSAMQPRTGYNLFAVKASAVELLRARLRERGHTLC